MPIAMKPSWLLQTDIFDENLGALVAEIKRQGMNVWVKQYVPFGGSEDDIFDFDRDLGPDPCIIFYGSIQFGNLIRRQTKWIPGVFCTMPNYACNVYYPQLPNLLVGDHYAMYPFGELIRLKEFLFREFASSGTIFIRPNSGNKIFTGQQFHWESFKSELDTLSSGLIDPSEIVVVSPPKNIGREWRFVIADHKVLAGSQYKSFGKSDVAKSYPKRAYDLSQKIAESGFEPDKAWCVDICEWGGKYYVLEIGGFSCAGLYECDLKAVVSGVSDVAQREWESYQ